MVLMSNGCIDLVTKEGLLKKNGEYVKKLKIPRKKKLVETIQLAKRNCIKVAHTCSSLESRGTVEPFVRSWPSQTIFARTGLTWLISTPAAVINFTVNTREFN
jgi:hypothetical protein